MQNRRKSGGRAIPRSARRPVPRRLPIAIHRRRGRRHARRPDASPSTAGGNAQRLCVWESWETCRPLGTKGPRTRHRRVCETQCSFIDEICTRDFKSVWEKFRLPARFGIAKPKGSGIITTCAIRRNQIFLGSSTAEHPAVNRRVVGSNPTRGAIGNRFSPSFQGLNFFHPLDGKGGNQAPTRSRFHIPARHGCAARRAARMAASKAGRSSASKR